MVIHYKGIHGLADPLLRAIARPCAHGRAYPLLRAIARPCALTFTVQVKFYFLFFLCVDYQTCKLTSITIFCNLKRIQGTTKTLMNFSRYQQIIT